VDNSVLELNTKVRVAMTKSKRKYSKVAWAFWELFKIFLNLIINLAK
jgi:hypothetical protein